METTLFYLFRVSISAAVLYGCYKLFLSRNTFHRLNRAVLLSIFSVSLILPMITVQLPEITKFKKSEMPVDFVPQAINQAIFQENQPKQTLSRSTIASTNQLTEKSTKKNSLWIYVYLSGVCFVLLRFAFAMMKIFQIIKRCRKKTMSDGTEIHVSPDDVSPFSWMNMIVISEKDFNDEKSDIICHESAHIAHRHSVDMMLANGYCTAFWFNPFAWLLRQELSNVHEYQADTRVVGGRSDLRDYQLLLIRHCVGEKKFAMANNFEYKNLQKRIQMTMRTQTSNRMKWLYGILIMAILVSIAGISCTKKNDKHESVKGRIHGTFNDSSINGKIQIHTFKKTSDIKKDRNGRRISETAPGDSLLAEFKVENGCFNYDYHFSAQHEPRLYFVDSNNLVWWLGFINPYPQSICRYSSSYCVLDNQSNINIKVLTKTKRISKNGTFLKLKVDAYRRSMKAQITGSPATVEIFKRQLNYGKATDSKNDAITVETGTVIDSRSHAKLSNVKIRNLNTGEETTSDKDGRFSIKTYPRQVLSFLLPGYFTSDYYVEKVGQMKHPIRKKVSNEQDEDAVKSGQTFTVTGEVLDDNFDPIANASIWVNGSKARFESNNNGKFTLKVKYRDIIYIAKNSFKDTATVFVKNNLDITTFLHK
jgi:hypothetical protein